MMLCRTGRQIHTFLSPGFMSGILIFDVLVSSKSVDFTVLQLRLPQAFLSALKFIMPG